MSFNIKDFKANSLYCDRGGLELREIRIKSMKEKTMSNVQNLIEEFNKFQEKFKKKAQDEFKKVFKNYWDENPKVHAVCWVQYTPYFNDGEPCVFSVGDMEPMTKEMYEEYSDNGGRWPEEYSILNRDYNATKPDGSKYNWDEKHPWILLEGWTQEEMDNAASIKELTKLDDSIFLAMFDDHVSVVATREGFDTEEFEHD